MSEQYPNPCCRCGFCCVVETCPIARMVYGVSKQDKCQAFKYDKFSKESTCLIAENGLPGIGDGCCMAARCYKDGIEYDFASLPQSIKKEVAYKTYGGKRCHIQ
jgi:hypothetical protein